MDDATPVGSEHRNPSPLGRLLEEVSWYGASVRRLRDGGQGDENVLTTEVLDPLDLLPRQAFLGAVLRGARGAAATRELLVAEIEQASVMVLPDEIRLAGPDTVVQPDARIESPGCLTLVEAKRIRSSKFQTEQLAREYLALDQIRGSRAPLLLVVLGAPPPARMQGHGLMALDAMVRTSLPAVHARAERPATDLPTLLDRVEDVLAWTTWSDVAATVADAAEALPDRPPSIAASVRRTAHRITDAVARHA